MINISNPSIHDLGRMVLNPDVITRFRGVMEKCSMCVQRIQAGKLEAKDAKTPVGDGEIKTACQQSCSTNAIMFGDVNDEQSQQLIHGEMMMSETILLLEEVGVKPASLT